MKSRSQRYDIKRPSPRYGQKYTKCKMYLSKMRLYVLSNTKATFEAQFMKKFSNTEAELKISVAYKKKRVVIFFFIFYFCTTVDKMRDSHFSPLLYFKWKPDI